MASTDFAIIGLGNPGRNYSETRHNVGFMLVDWLAERHDGHFGAHQQHVLTARLRLDGTRVRLVKPQTYMNKSGPAVAAFTRYFALGPDRFVVVHDDLDMHLGRVKLVHNGGSGGHNGIRSIVSALGTTDFWRLKIGIGRPGDSNTHPDMEVDRFVLSSFSSEEMGAIAERFAAIESGLRWLLDDDPARARTCLNAIR